MWAKFKKRVKKGRHEKRLYRFKFEKKIMKVKEKNKS
jgi:hypothetical protein